jgi:hypothetical protein
MNFWPLTLPQYPYFDFNASVMEGLLSPDESNNPIRTRTYPEHEATYKFRQLSLSQLNIFKEFYNTTLNQCAPFSAPWLSLCGYNFHFLRFTESPAFALNGRLWDIEIKVEIIAHVPINDGFVDYWLPEI